MNKFVRLTLLTVLVLAGLLGAASQAKAVGIFIYIPMWDTEVNWVAPDGLPAGVSGTEFALVDTETFIYKGVTYSPPKEWMLFAGDGFLLDGFNELKSPVEICFSYPKAWASMGEWFPKIYRLYGGQWTGFPTTQKTVPGYGALPFVCTSTKLPGMYIVADYYFCEGICEEEPTQIFDSR